VLKTGIHCNVTLIKGIGTLVTDTIGPFKNLILTNGLDSLANNEFNAWVTYCHVGTGSNPVSIGQTGLQDWVASTNNVIDSSTSTKGLAPFYSQRIKRWRFAAGTFNNHVITEVSFSNQASNGAAFSRALVSESIGQFTSSWVRADEWLDVVYDFRLYPQFINTDGSLNDGSGTIEFKGVTYDYLIRPANVTTLLYWDASKAIARAVPVSSNYMCGYSSSSVLGLVTNQPTTPAGTNATTINSTFAYNTYSAGTYTRDIFYNLGPAALATTLGAVRFHTGFGAYQMQFTPPLAKGADVMSFRVTLTWGNIDVIT